MQIYITKIKNRVVIKRNNQILESTKKVIAKDKNGENASKLEIVDVMQMHCNDVNYNNQQASNVLFMFVSDKQFRQLTTVATHSLTILKTTNAKFPFIKVWLTDQNTIPLKIESNVNITLIIGTD